MVEFAATAAFTLLIIGSIFDVGFALYEYNYLNYSTTKAAREIAAQLATTSDCNVISKHLHDVAHPEIANAINAGAAASWSYCIAAVGSKDCLAAGGANPQFKALRLTGNLPLNCYFLCQVLPKNWSVTATSSASLDSAAVPVCPAGGPIS